MSSSDALSSVPGRGRPRIARRSVLLALHAASPIPPPATQTRARRIALKNVVRYAYTGNVHDREGGTTTCHNCGAALIGRDWYVLTDWNLTDDGRCARCGAACPGVFDGPPGSWGARRMPVRLMGSGALPGP